MKTKKYRLGKRLVYFYMLLCVIPVLLFLAFIVANSFMSVNEFTDRFGMLEDGNQMKMYAEFSFIPDDFSFTQYKEAFWDKSDFWYYFWNSVVISSIILVGTLVVSVMGGYAFAKLKFPFKRIAFLSLLLIMMLPYQIMLAPQLMMLQKVKLLNKVWAVILPNIFNTFGTYLIYQFVDGIPDECIEAAKIDGAGRLRVFIHIVIPQIKGGICALIMLNLIDTWNLVEQPVLFLQNQYLYPLSVVLSNHKELVSSSVFACCFVFLIPILLVFVICRNSLLKGIQSSVVLKK